MARGITPDPDSFYGTEVYSGKDATITRLMPGFLVEFYGRHRKICQERRVDYWTEAVQLVLAVRQIVREYPH